MNQSLFALHKKRRKDHFGYIAVCQTNIEKEELFIVIYIGNVKGVLVSISFRLKKLIKKVKKDIDGFALKKLGGISLISISTGLGSIHFFIFSALKVPFLSTISFG